MRTNRNLMIRDLDGIKRLVLDVLHSHGWNETGPTCGELVREFSGGAGGGHRAQVLLLADGHEGVCLSAVLAVAGGATLLPASEYRIAVGSTVRDVAEAANAFVKAVLRALAKQLAQQLLSRNRNA